MRYHYSPCWPGPKTANARKARGYWAGDNLGCLGHAGIYLSSRSHARDKLGPLGKPLSLHTFPGLAAYICSQPLAWRSRQAEPPCLPVKGRQHSLCPASLWTPCQRKLAPFCFSAKSLSEPLVPGALSCEEFAHAPCSLLCTILKTQLI